MVKGVLLGPHEQAELTRIVPELWASSGQTKERGHSIFRIEIWAKTGLETALLTP